MPTGHVFHPRRPLYYWERRKLEKEFGEQVPLFSEYARKRRFLHNLLFASPLVAVPVAIAQRRRTHQPIAAAVIGLMSFLVAFTGIKTFGPIATGMTKFDKREYERAFNLWVYYKDRAHIKMPIETAEERYQEKLQKFREEQRAAGL